MSDQITADVMRAVQHDTFGYLFPSKEWYWIGSVRVSFSAYGNVTVLDDKVEGIEPSPWWYASLNDFAVKCSDSMGSGEVAEFQITVKRVILEDDTYDPDDEYDEPKNEERLVISEISKKILVKGW